MRCCLSRVLLDRDAKGGSPASLQQRIGAAHRDLGSDHRAAGFHAAEVHLGPGSLEQLQLQAVDAASPAFYGDHAIKITIQAEYRCRSIRCAVELLPTGLKKRLGYTGLLYKRDPSRFFYVTFAKQERENLAPIA